jgi:hypothetical protein
MRLYLDANTAAPSLVTELVGRQSSIDGLIGVAVAESSTPQFAPGRRLGHHAPGTQETTSPVNRRLTAH